MKKEHISDAPPAVTSRCTCIDMFDRRASGKLSMGGFVCFNSKRKYISCAALWYRAKCPTNNMVEAYALYNLLGHLVAHGLPQGNKTLIIYSDSRLVIGFVN